MISDSTTDPTNGFPTISRREWLFVWLAFVFVMLVTALPYIFGYLSAPADKQFMGIMIDVPDHAQYFSWMRELSDQLLSSNKLTPERSQPIFHNLLWWMLGQAGRILGLNYAVLFQGLRVVSTALYMPLAYYVCAWFLPGVFTRVLAFLLVVFASGFGWVIIVAKYLFQLTDIPLPVQLLVYIMEPNTFFSILATPHLIAAALYMLAFVLVLKGERRKQLRYAVLAGILGLFLGWQHAYDLFLIYSILGAYGLLKILRDRKIPTYLLLAFLFLGIISIWPGLYSALLTTLDPNWKIILAQYSNAGVYTPHPLLLWVLLGPTFLIAIAALIKMRFWDLSYLDDRTLFLVAWFWSNLFLLYLPTDFQIKMLNGFQVPLAILTAWGFDDCILPSIRGWVQERSWHINPGIMEKGVMLLFILFAALTNIYLWSWRFVDLARHDYPYYLNLSEIEALDCLGQTGNDSEAVIASLTIGQYLPALTGKYAFVAHWAQTVDYNNKLKWSEQFYDASTNDAWRRELLSDFQIDYVFYGPAEQALGIYQPAQAPYLEPTECRSGDVVVFKVR